jgi:Bacterial Ig-like domain
MSDPITSLHYSPNANIVNGQYVPASDGFNLADVSSVDDLNSLPAGVEGLVWLGMTGGATASFQSVVSQFIGNPKLYGFYLADEPDPSLVSAANLKAESDWIHANVPGAKTFIVLLNEGTPTQPSYVNTYNSANTDIDLFGLDPYPVRPQFTGGVNYSVIPDAVSAAEATGITLSQIVPVYQAFGGGQYTSYTMPTASQEQQLLSTWGSIVPSPAFDYAYSWGVQQGDMSLSGSTALQQVFAVHNALTSTAPAAPTIADASDVNGTINAANDTAAQALTGTAGANDTINVYLNGATTAAYTTQANASGSWSQTIGVLANGAYSYTATATDAAGNVSAPSSPLAFTVATTGPSAPTIADASDVNGTVNAANDTASQALTGTAGANDTINVYLNGAAVFTTQANASGNWSQTIGVLANGAYSYTATATDAAGNVSAPSSPLAFTVATTGPSAPTIADAAVVNGTVNAANDTAAQALAGTAGANDTINVYLNGATTAAYTTQASASGNWSQTIGVLPSGSYSYTATATDAAGNISAPSSPLAFTVNTSAPSAPTISDASVVNGYVNAANDTPSQALSGTAGANATIKIYLNGATTAVYTTQANAGGSWSQTIGVLANGTYSYTATATDAAGNVSAPGSPLAFTVDVTAPTIAISAIASNNIINATKAAQGFAISGTTSGAENGQIVTVNIVNSANTIVDAYTVADNNNAWSVPVTSAQATALADGSYTVTAIVSDKAGNPASTASHALTVDEDKLPEAPALTIGNTSLTVQAGGSVALGITATPVDTDDRLSVKISGVPSYESITAPTGDTVTKQQQSNGIYTWTITESTSKAGTAITGLSLTSHYRGTGHPVATLTVTASDITTGETATSASQTLAVTDPPATPMAEFASPGARPLASSMPSPAYATLAALFAQHLAAWSGSDALGMSQMAWTAPPQLDLDTGSFLTRPHS